MNPAAPGIGETIGAGDLRAGTDATRAKIKFDRQILAIARVQKQSVIYSDDQDVAKQAQTFGLEAIPIWQLPLPPENPQGVLLEA